jgi:hypothetical protein
VLIAATRQYVIGCACRQSTTTGAPGDRLRYRLQKVMSANRRHSAVCDGVRQPGDQLHYRLQEAMSASQRHSAVCDWVRQPVKARQRALAESPGRSTLLSSSGGDECQSPPLGSMSWGAPATKPLGGHLRALI